MLDWAVGKNAPVLIINADIHLQMAPWEMKRIRWLSDGGICAFIRHNHNGDFNRTTPEFHGLDAFLFHGRDAIMFPDSFLSMGQPFWDFWLPYTFASQIRPIYIAEFPAAFHQSHPSSWSWETWYRCGLEFDRLTGELCQDQSFEAYHAMSGRVRGLLDQKKISLNTGDFHGKS
ncbi:MAG TPA: hypothetical protein VE735_09185 [Gammaproteobacteria bacterium]|jgi:hypothetical protein|nr:hypothetical protein [Gammaproteobacteria bacterium]